MRMRPQRVPGVWFSGRPGGRRRGFTLVEVLLAVGITLGLMVVVLFFYQQTARLRLDVLGETERIATVRMVMDRLTMELRTAVAHEYLPAGLVGDSNFIMFARVAVPERPAWYEDGPVTDLRLVQYGGVDLSGLTRQDVPLMKPLWTVLADEEAEGDVAEEEEEGLAGTWGDGRAPLLTDQIRYLRFRYWNGWWWQAVWEGWELPLGVEVTLGFEPMPDEAEDYPYELFRRVIHLPSSGGPDGFGMFELFGDAGRAADEGRML